MNVKIDSTPYQEALIKRRAQSSIVIIFKTSDPKRLIPFIKFIYSFYEERVRKRTERSETFSIYLFKIWSGLFKCNIVDNNVVFEPVTLGSGSSPLIQAISSGNRIRDLITALNYIDNLMETQRNICFVLYGLFKRDDNLIAFLRNAIFTDSYYEKGHTIVLFLDNPHEVIDDDTLKHSIYIEIPPSTDKERQSLINNIIDELGNKIMNGVDISQLVEATRGLNLHETESVVLESIFKFRKVDPIILAQFKNEIVRKSGILDIENPEHGFEAVGGYQVVKQFIINNIIKVLKNPEKAKKLGLRPPRGILLFGPPGTGKTWLARALAKELKLPFLRLRTERIFSEFVGRTERNISYAISIAESVAPCIFFIDEVDRFGRRTMVDTDSGTTRRTFSILLEWLGDDKRKTIVVATTNVPEQLDEAFIRVGRFDYIIPILYPDYNARIEILKVHTQVKRKVPLAENVKLEEIAAKTEFFTGAELEELVLRAARNALREDVEVVEMKHFEKAFSTFRINMNERQKQLQHYLKLAEEYCNDTEFLELLKHEIKSAKSRLDVLKEELS